MNIDELSKFGVSDTIIDRLTDLGFESLTETQERAIEAGLFDGKSLLIDAPTNTGKTFIGELAALNASKQRDRRRSFFIVPLRALAEQMFNDLVEKYEEWGLQTAISTSDHYEYDNSLMDYDVIISTYEKLNGLLVKRPDIIKDIGLVVIDEIQHMGDKSRGVSLEMLLTRLKFFSNEPQIVGLSATAFNAKELADWLKCKLIHVERRDVELRKGIIYVGSGSVTFHGFSLNRGDFVYKEFNSNKVDMEEGLNLNDIESISERSEKEQCLIFVNTQRKAERLSQRISQILRERPKAYKLIEEIDEFVESSPSTRTVKKTLKRGVAFHHAGLLADERRIIEDGFRRGLIRVICSTPTLSAGVNTPAKNVIILFSTYYNGSYLFVRTYKNISGRAGRLRKAEEFGRSILLAENKRKLEYLWDNYIEAKPEAVRSQISGKIGFGCSLLGLLSSKVCSTREELLFFMELTFFGYTMSREFPDGYKEKLCTEVNHEVDRFVKMGFITENEQLKITALGQRCAEELLSPDTVGFLYENVDKNKAKISEAEDYENLVTGILHLCCCTADSANLFPPRSRTEIQELEATWRVNRDAYFFNPPDSDSFLKTLRTTRMILRWMEGITYFELSSYAPAGTIKRIAGNLQWILRALARICKKPLFHFEFEFTDFLYQLSERAYFGVPKEALQIARLRLKGIHRRRSMNLANAGYKDIDSLLEASIEELLKVPDIGIVLVHRLKESVEKYIEDNTQRQKARQVRLASQIEKSTQLVSGIYDFHGDHLTRHIVKIFVEEFGFDAEFIGESREHEPDILLRTPEGNITIEVKRKEKGKVSALESEEILGKGAKYDPIANVTIGYPDFVKVAKENAMSANITLIAAPILGEMLIRYWKGTITSEEIISLLKSGKYVYGIGEYYL